MNLKKEITLADLGKAFSRKPKSGGSTPKARVRKPEKTPRELVGLEIGASKLAAAHIVNNGSPELKQIASGPLEGGFVVNGEVKDVDGLATALSEFFDRHSLPRKGIRLGLANSRIGVRPFEIEGVSDERQLENAIRFRAQELLPIPLEEAVIDHHVLDQHTDDAGNTVWRVLLVVAHRGLIDGYVDACRKAGLELAGIDLEAFGLLRALAQPRTGEEPSALVAVSLGHERATLAVSDGKVCEFTRVLEWGGASLNAAIAKVLEITPREADRIKQTLVLGGDGETVSGVPGDKAEAVLAAVRRELQTFARELVSSLQFYQGQPSSLPISEVVITGGTASMAGLAEELQTLIRVGVRVGDPKQRLRLAASVDQLQSLEAATVAIGLGIEDPHMRAVNLLNSEAFDVPGKRLQVPKSGLAIAAGVLGAAVCGFVALSFVNARSDVAGLNDELDAVQAQDAALVARQPKGDPLMLADRRQRESALATALAYRVAWENLLGDVGYVLPANVLLTTLHAETPTSPVSGAVAAAPVDAAAPSTFTVVGTAPSQRAVAQALRRLAVVPGLTGVTLTSSVGSGTEIAFTIAANVRTKEGIKP
jgi:type IV pilus assembly protein PilM